MPDSLGDRMKAQYESRTRMMLPRRTYTLIRVDGKAFHTWTRHSVRPYDVNLARCFDVAAAALCKEAQGASLAYLQSDEISVLLTDFATDQTCAWFDGNVQKIASVAASCVTAHFNEAAGGRGIEGMLGLFDARVWTIPDPTEVSNYFIWRQQDAERNSLSMLASCHFSHAELHGRDAAARHDMLHGKGINWNALPIAQKRGRCIFYHDGIGKPRLDAGWQIHNEIPVFISDEGREWLRARIPRYV